MVERNNQNQLDGNIKPLQNVSETSDHFAEGKLSNVEGDFEFEDTDIINPSELSNEPSYKRVNTPNPFGRTVQVDLDGPRDSETPPDTLIATKEWQIMSGKFQKVSVNTDTKTDRKLKDDPKENIEILLAEELFDEKTLKNQITDYLGEFFDQFNDIQKLKAKAHKLDNDLFWLINSEVKNNSKKENIQTLFNIFCELKKVYEEDTDKDEFKLKYHKEVLLPRINRAIGKIEGRLPSFNPRKEVVAKASDDWRLKNYGDALLSVETVGIYDFSSGRDLEEKMEIVLETVRKHANEVLRRGKNISETVEIIYYTALKTVSALPETDKMRFFLINLNNKIAEISKEVEQSLSESKELLKNALKEHAIKKGSDPGRSCVNQTAVKKIEKTAKAKKPSRWAKIGSTFALLTTLVFSAISAKNSCESEKDDPRNDLITMNKGDETSTKEETLVDDEIIIEQEAMAEEENLIPINVDEEWEKMADEDFITPMNDAENFDFTAIDELSVEDAEEDVHGLSVFQEEILPNDGMYKFLNKWKKIRSMRNVEDPSVFDKYSDYEIMAAMAEWSDAKALEMGIKDYKKIGKNLMLRRASVVLLPENAAEIANILNGEGFEKQAKKTLENYEKWRDVKERAENEKWRDVEERAENEKLITADLDSEWEKMLDDDYSDTLTDDLIPINVDEKVADDLIPIDNESPDDLIPIDLDLEWEKMLDADFDTLADDTNKKVSTVMNEIDTDWLDMDDEDDEELELALSQMIKK